VRYTHIHVHIRDGRCDIQDIMYIDISDAFAITLLTLYTNLYLIASDIIMQPIVCGEGDREQRCGDNSTDCRYR